MWIHAITLSLVWCIVPVLCNVEKTIFLAPQAINIPTQHPNLETLRLDSLSSAESSLRRQLPAAFPTSERDKGLESWYLLDELNQHQRYEVRICWAATVSSRPLIFLLYFISKYASSLSLSTFTYSTIATNIFHSRRLSTSRSA